jgi:hypothetical protein
MHTRCSPSGICPPSYGRWSCHLAARRVAQTALPLPCSTTVPNVTGDGHTMTVSTQAQGRRIQADQPDATSQHWAGSKCGAWDMCTYDRKTPADVCPIALKTSLLPSFKMVDGVTYETPGGHNKLLAWPCLHTHSCTNMLEVDLCAGVWGRVLTQSMALRCQSQSVLQPAPLHHQNPARDPQARCR